MALWGIQVPNAPLGTLSVSPGPPGNSMERNVPYSGVGCPRTGSEGARVGLP